MTVKHEKHQVLKVVVRVMVMIFLTLTKLMALL